ncbi:hypothetical protein AVEN_42424-1 [Araneus ventricosus]|uniref:Uncharacterized protein n=1 Tax=Araneus ventricosus TaxID=182803 RepID=A0A4Y2R5M2_ARAVE|nr:hypothetical protein AVEN_42424-1 [Araneus ventricosus]
MELTIVNIIYWILFRYTHTTWNFFVLANFLGALNLQLGSISFLAIVDACCIFGELEHQKPKCANLAENARCAYKGAKMLCAELASCSIIFKEVGHAKASKNNIGAWGQAGAQADFPFCVLFMEETAFQRTVLS